ncbi:hypothetical protein, partial [Klebsiella pneumoniae]|uniref:hypothetical protein n=1 Tax=Klebsiella pneumoniae TaxID=573 RepID=UPI001C693EF7
LMMNPVPWLQMTNMISYQGLVRTFPMSFAWQCLFTATSLSGENTRSLEPETKQATSVISAV